MLFQPFIQSAQQEQSSNKVNQKHTNMGVNTQTMKTEYNTKGVNTTLLPNSSTQTLKTAYETRGQEDKMPTFNLLHQHKLGMLRT